MIQDKMRHLVAGLRHSLNPSKSHRQDKKQNNAGHAVPEAMSSNSDGIHVSDLSHVSHARKISSITSKLKRKISSIPSKLQRKISSIIPYKYRPCYGPCAVRANLDAFDVLESRNPTILEDIMGALTDPNTHLLGIHGSDDVVKNALLQKVYRRILKDQLFGMVVTARVTKYRGVRKIQDHIAPQLGFSFNHKSKSKAKRASELNRSIKNKQNMLIILCDVYKGFDPGKVGIPYGADHTVNKILLTSTSEDVLSSHMHTQINFMV